jgi:tRNA threonylcarbamoyl adenosine modification protein YeaZ
MSPVASNVLAIDTSGSFCSIAVSNSFGNITSRSSSGSGDHFEQLPLMLRRTCDDAGVSMNSLKEIRIGVGPGSFTGLRIGMSFAKGLAWSLRIPLMGCGSLAGVAAAALAQDESVHRVVVLADARRDEVFAAAYKRGASLEEEISPRIVPVADLAGSEWSKEGTRWCSPQRDFLLSGYVLVPEPDTAKGLLILPGAAPVTFAVEEIAVLEPSYLRAVAAKTIEERKLGT